MTKEKNTLLKVGLCVLALTVIIVSYPYLASFASGFVEGFSAATGN